MAVRYYVDSFGTRPTVSNKDSVMVSANDYDALQSKYVALCECVRAAIKAGDWKVDGACDPEIYMDEPQP